MVRETVELSPDRIRHTLLVFQVADQQYAVAAGDVAEILPIAELQRPPGAPEVLAGFLDLGGELIPVIRVHHLFGLPQAAPDLWTPLVILRDGDERIALWVDSVNRTLVVEDADVLPLPSQHVTNECVTGVVRSGNASLSLLSPQRLLLAQETRAITELQQMVQKRVDSLEGVTA